MKWKWRLNLYDFYAEGFPCAIMKQSKSNLILKFLVNLKNVSQYGLLICNLKVWSQNKK